MLAYHQMSQSSAAHKRYETTPQARMRRGYRDLYFWNRWLIVSTVSPADVGSENLLQGLQIRK